MSSGMNPRSDAERAAQAKALAQDIAAVLGKLKRRLREQAHVGDLTPSQTSTLLRLERHGPATASSLARAEGMRPQSMGAVIMALEAAGMVRGAPDPNDGRQTILSLTDAFQQRIREGRAARQDWLSGVIQARLSPREQTEIASAITLLKRLVDD
jgi:DNA-binding MarR family transcriptional regulator